ncbi:MAG: sulfatase [Opitutaceae bacterium]|nr:sulfatase [Opitutaceae bacterium]
MFRFLLLNFSFVFLSISWVDAKPLNVVFYLIDDMGWKDIGANGSDYYQTPNIDKLAADGMRFTNGYAVCSVCSPTRASVMTGKYPARLMLTQWLPSGRWDAKKHKLKEARYLAHLPLEEFTIAEALRDAGYKTAFMGKWHLGSEPYYFPRHQGFDINVGGRDYGAPGSYWYPYQGRWLIPTTPKLYSKRDTVVEGKEGDYLIDRIAEEGDKFIRAHADQPFFLMMSHYGVHTPLQGKPDKVARYEKIPEDQRQGSLQYAAMVESIDDSVGRIVKAVEEMGVLDNTMIIFTSDNGGYWRATKNKPLRANKGSNYEGGLRVPVIFKWPGAIKPGSVSEVLMSSIDYYPTILAAAGLDLIPTQHMDGVDLTPVLKGEGNIDRESLFWHYPHYNQHPQSFPGGIIRKGDWKLIERFEDGGLELYNLGEDVREKRNLASQRPELAQRMLSEMRVWRHIVRADPMKPNPLYEGK